MKLEEVGQILVKIATYSKMTPPSQGDIAAWHDLPEIQRMDFERAKRAVAIYYQQHKSPMAAVDLIQTVKITPSEKPVTGTVMETGPLIGIQEYGVQRFIDEFNGARSAKGEKPMSPELVLKIMKRNGLKIPDDEEIPY